MAMLFEQRHFEALAEHWRGVLGIAWGREAYEAVETVLYKQLVLMRQHNYKFRVFKFLEVCGYTEHQARKLLAKHGWPYT